MDYVLQTVGGTTANHGAIVGGCCAVAPTTVRLLPGRRSYRRSARSTSWAKRSPDRNAPSTRFPFVQSPQAPIPRLGS